MSIDEMAVVIQGGNLELLEPLWEQVIRLVKSQANRHWTATQGRGGVVADDLIQIGYLAMVDAISRYDPDKAAFTTYLVQYLQKYFHEATGRCYTDSSGRLMPKDALNVSVSLNMPVDDDEETELLEIVADPATSCEDTEEKIWQEQLRETMSSLLQELPAEQMEILRCRFWEDLTREETAERLGNDTGSIRMAESKAMRTLAQPKNRRRLMPFVDFDYYGGSGLGAFRASGMSVQERYLVLAEKQREKP